MVDVDGKLCGSQRRELLRAWLLSHADISCERVDELLDQLGEEEGDCVDDLELLDLECCLKQVTARKIRRALAKRESGCCAAEGAVSPGSALALWTARARLWPMLWQRRAHRRHCHRREAHPQWFDG